ncbi:bestrophin-like domain [Limobrevibacterium gyesilva]|uniref:DUF4239 domain-containing protein n=1 Tax=Limobrevibacterium gyesilva TaxID=2991712 RepID=A0AA42CIR3_9PROT|nr:DUF4239 domain-containing protein [Limobrevibacterium gyesilva]MCW3476192.1 DUF4239 domain-containing protein [Limobrevibacterium gyesilva]
MGSIAISLTVAACVFAGGAGALFMHHLLPDSHRTRETQDVVRLGTGMLSVIASLVLGLLIATAKGTYDRSDHDIRSYAAELILLNETLRDYGRDASEPRRLLRAYTGRLLEHNWLGADGERQMLEDRRSGAMLEHVREAIRGLKPVDAGQTWLQDQALQITISLMRQRWLLIEQQGPSVRPVIVIILVAWITLIFASFGLNAPRNATVVTAFLVCALAIGGAIFLILEMDNPFTGLLQISSRPVENALTYMSP